MLLFSCDVAATQTHTELYTVFLQTMCAQLSLALPASASADGKQGASDASLNVPMESVGFEDSLQDLLDDSFLKQAVLSFLEVMLDERESLPSALWYQVC